MMDAVETETQFCARDRDGDTLTIERGDTDDELFVRAHRRGVYLTPDQARELAGYLLDFLNTACDSECTAEGDHRVTGCVTEDADDFPCCAPGSLDHDPHTDYGLSFADAAGVLHRRDESSIASEAHAAVYGDRQDDYGHPREDFTRTAIIWTGLLQHKLKPGQAIEPEDIARCMVGVKLSRDVNAPKRDNRVDGAGYFITLDRLETGQ